MKGNRHGLLQNLIRAFLEIAFDIYHTVVHDCCSSQPEKTTSRKTISVLGLLADLCISSSYSRYSDHF